MPESRAAGAGLADHLTFFFGGPGSTVIAVDPTGTGTVPDFNTYVILFGDNVTQNGSLSTQQVIDNLTASGNLAA